MAKAIERVRGTGFEQDDDVALDEPMTEKEWKAANEARASFSVLKNVPKQRKFVLTIAEVEDKNAINPVNLINGDFGRAIYRGRHVVVPECLIESIKDARGLRYDQDRARWVPFQSYAYQATPYDGPHPIDTELDDNGDAMPRIAMPLIVQS